ncbi:hypothetical protein ACFQ1S_30555, partial [Kibdelosporangium lantanae]
MSGGSVVRLPDPCTDEEFPHACPRACGCCTIEDSHDARRAADVLGIPFYVWDFTERNITHDMATSTWVDNAITVNGRTWPVLRMQWVEGRTLNHHVEDLVEDEDTASIRALADNWRDLVRRIQTARFAHGDLQHGNVMVEGDGTLRLVDFDSAWIEPFAG